MTVPFDHLPPELPRLELALEQPAPTAWMSIVRRARWRRRRAVAVVVAVVVAIGTVPAVALLPRSGAPVVPAHQPGRGFNGVCDTPHDVSAPAGDRVVEPFRSGMLLVTSPGDNAPAVSSEVLRARLERRGVALQAGTQLRYGLVRRVGRNGQVSTPQLRWILTTCGLPRQQPKDPQAPPPRPGVKVPTVTVLQDDIQLLSDTGSQTNGYPADSFRGICQTRLDAPPPPGGSVPTFFHVGEIQVTPAEQRALPGRDKVLSKLRNRFPGTQVRLGLVQPLHAPGQPQLRWVVTTCGLDGASVRPRMPGVVNEALVFDGAGHLLAEHRSGPQSEAEQAIRNAPPLPTVLPTYAPPGPDLCGTWRQAYKPFPAGMTAAGYTRMEGCVLQQTAVVVYLSSRTNGAAAAVSASVTGAYQDQYDKRFPFDGFELVPAPNGATDAHLLRFLSRTVAEVELSGPGVPAYSYKFDSASRQWLDCADRTATLQPCRGR